MSVCNRKDKAMKETIIKTDKLSKSFSVGGRQQHIIKNMDLEIYKGDFTVIMGSSGAGKSTLLYALSGMDKPSLGSIRYSGEEITKMNDDQLAVFRRKHCGFIFQQIHLVDSMSIMDNAISDVASWVVPHSEGPRFPGPLLIRTRCPDTSSNSTL